MDKHVSKFSRYELVQMTEIGCIIDNRDYTFKTDRPISVTLIPTNDELHGVKMCKRPYVAQIVQFIRITRELAEYLPLIRTDIIDINSKYSNLQYATLDIDTNPFNVHVTYLRNVVLLTSYHAILFVDRPGLFAAFVTAINNLMSYNMLEHDDEFMQFTTVGAEYREGESIFHRAVHHYKHTKQLLKDSYEHTNTNERRSAI